MDENILEIAEKIQLKQLQDNIDRIRNHVVDSLCDNCIDCDIEIPLKRKHAYPSCVRCIECQTAYENN